MSLTTGIFISHFPDELSNKSHTNRKRGVSCGGNQLLFINFGVRTQKIRRAYLNGQIVSEFVFVCLNLNLKFCLNFTYARRRVHTQTHLFKTEIWNNLKLPAAETGGRVCSLCVKGRQT